MLCSLLLTALIQGGNSWPLYLPHKTCQLLFLLSNEGWRRLPRDVCEPSMLQELISQLLGATRKSITQACPRSAGQLVFLVVLVSGYIWPWKKFSGQLSSGSVLDADWGKDKDLGLHLEQATEIARFTSAQRGRDTDTHGHDGQQGMAAGTKQGCWASGGRHWAHHWPRASRGNQGGLQERAEREFHSASVPGG